MNKYLESLYRNPMVATSYRGLVLLLLLAVLLITHETCHARDLLRMYMVPGEEQQPLVDMNTVGEKTMACKIETQQQNKRRIIGRVTNQNGLALPGVSIAVKGTSYQVVTKVDGTFEVTLPEEGRVTLVFTGKGIKPCEILVTDQIELNVVLTGISGTELEEFLTTGYQQIDQKHLTGSVTVVKADELKIDGVADVSRMLEGKVAGLSVSNESETFGMAPNIKIRGASSIHGNNGPLWVIDGIVREDVVNVSPEQSVSEDLGTLISSSVAGLNPNDIESIQVLRDVAATALYGARAMNGVIVINTRKGHAGKNSLNITSEFTMKMKPTYADYNMMSSQDQMEVLREMETKGWFSLSDLYRMKDGGILYRMYDLMYTYEDGEFPLDNTPEARVKFLSRYENANTDWFDLLFQTGFQQQHTVSYSGGGEKGTFYTSLGFLQDGGWTIADNLKRCTAMVNGTWNITPKCTLRAASNMSVRDQELFGLSSVETYGGNTFDNNPFVYATTTSRALTAYDEKGELEFYRKNYADYNIIDELGKNQTGTNVNDFSFGADLDYKLRPNLTLSGRVAARFYQAKTNQNIHEDSNESKAYRAGINDPLLNGLNPLLYREAGNTTGYGYSILPEGGIYRERKNYMENFYFNGAASWIPKLGEDHSFSFLVGAELRKIDREYSWNDEFGHFFEEGKETQTSPYYFDLLAQVGKTALGKTKISDRFVAFYSNYGYSYQGKYILNGTLRFDAANRIEGKSEWIPTWSLSGRWNAKEEDGVSDVEWISKLAVRGAYGMTASIGPGNAISNGISNRWEGQNSSLIESLENSDLTWEKQKEINVGFDVGFHNRISLSVDAYKRKGYDLVALVRTSGIGGEAWKLTNYADMTTNGIEFSLGTRNIVTSDFDWTSNLTFAFNENEITNLKNHPTGYDLVQAQGGAKEGGPVRGIYSIPFAGLDAIGLPQFYDSNGNITQEVNLRGYETSNLKYEGPADPNITGGFSNVFRYRNWKLNVFCSYQLGNVIRLTPYYQAVYNDIVAFPVEMNNRWKKTGDENSTDIPAIVSSRIVDAYGYRVEKQYEAYNYSDVRVAKGDFIRLKEISLEYQLPENLMKRIGISNASLKVQGTNLFLLYSDSALNGQDPETLGIGGYALPVPKQVTFSLKMNI